MTAGVVFFETQLPPDSAPTAAGAEKREL